MIDCINNQLKLSKMQDEAAAKGYLAYDNVLIGTSGIEPLSARRNTSRSSIELSPICINNILP